MAMKSRLGFLTPLTLLSALSLPAAAEIQYDISKDKSEYSYPFFGDSKVLSISLQGVF
jgi:hypothetical protein